MNWRSIKYLAEDDYGKPLLFKMPGDQYYPVNYFTGHVSKRAVYTATLTIHGFHEERFLMLTGRIPPGTQYLRIDEIMD